MTLTDQSPTGGAVDVRYDLDGNGKLTWDIVAGGGAEWNAITGAFPGAGQKVVIVRDMVSVYYLAANAARGDTVLTINSASSFLLANAAYPVGTGAHREQVTVQRVVGATVTLTAPLAHAHASGETLEFPAGGWGGNPVIIIEGAAGQNVLQWTFGHELGHAVLGLSDVEAIDTIMHWQQSWTDYRLRFMRVPFKYAAQHAAADQSQWEEIGR
jgi:hypothetical protein